MTVRDYAAFKLAYGAALAVLGYGHAQAMPAPTEQGRGYARVASRYRLSFADLTCRAHRGHNVLVVMLGGSLVAGPAC